MKALKTTIRNHPMLAYFGLVFLISWGGGWLVVGPRALPMKPEEFATLGMRLYAAILAGPAVAGIVLTAIVSGRPGLRELFSRLQRWRVGWRWYALGVVPVLLTVATTMLLSLVSADFRPAFLDSPDQNGIIMAAFGPALLVGIFEEIGWTGFAVPHLRSRHSILATGLAVGVVWGAWHFPLFWERDSFSATIPLAVLLTRLFSWLPPLRVVLVWIHDRTESLPAVMFTHIAVTFISLVLMPEGLAGGRLLTSLLVSAAAMWLFLGSLMLASNRESLRPLRRRPA